MGRIICMKSLIAAFLLAFLVFSGCKGSDTREKVDDTVEELAGKKKVDQMKDMERSIGQIEDQQSERLDQLDEMDDEE